MNTRTQQDNDITLYSYDELKSMKARYDSNSTTWQPFTPQEVKAEIKRRVLETEISLSKQLFDICGVEPSIISPEIKPFAVFSPKDKAEYLTILNKLKPTEELAKVKFASGNPINTFSPYLITYGGKHESPDYMNASVKFKHSICPIWVKMSDDLLKNKFSVSTIEGEHIGFGRYKRYYTLAANDSTSVQVYYGENKTMYAANEAEAEHLKEIIFK